MESGQIIAGKYRLNQLLGTGGMAQVWSGTNTFTERQFAIKFMLPSVARTAEAAQRFLMEAKASARINHPNIVEIMDVGQTDDGALFLVMELLSGVALETALRRQNPPMTVYELIVIMLDVARALGAAHKAGVVHRDLKPTNVYLHKDRAGIAVPKILDFGVSKFQDDNANGALTVAGTVLGSPLYMSPEQAMGAPNVDGRTDVFAFGGILFEALVGYRCYDAPNFNALIVTIATTQPRSIDEAAPHLPEALRALVRDCLVTDRNKRISTFAEVVERLSLIAPSLEHDPLRIPSPISKGPPSDPDATNALPAVVRPSDRPPSFFNTQTGVRAPSGSYSSPWTPSGSMAPPAARGFQPTKNVLIGAGVVASTCAIAILAFSIGRGGAPNPSSIPPASAAVTSGTLARAGSLDGTQPPVVQVDALPSAAAPRPAGLRGTGNLLVAAQPGACNLSVDGHPFGVTPISTQLSVGNHTLKCDFVGGKSKSASIDVVDGQTTRYKFTHE
jgi:serine/threonine-protein kinase